MTIEELEKRIEELIFDGHNESSILSEFKRLFNKTNSQRQKEIYQRAIAKQEKKMDQNKKELVVARELLAMKKEREAENGRSCGNCIFFKKPKTLNDAGRCKNESIINCIGCEGGFAFYCDDNFYCKYWKPTETKGAGVS